MNAVLTAFILKCFCIFQRWRFYSKNFVHYRAKEKITRFRCNSVACTQDCCAWQLWLSFWCVKIIICYSLDLSQLLFSRHMTLPDGDFFPQVLCLSVSFVPFSQVELSSPYKLFTECLSFILTTQDSSIKVWSERRLCIISIPSCSFRMLQRAMLVEHFAENTHNGSKVSVIDTALMFPLTKYLKCC